MSNQVITHFNSEMTIVLSCDASDRGIRTIIFHRFEDNSERPISFASRSLSLFGRNYSTPHKEALFIIWGVTKFYQFVKGRDFTIKSDHKPLTTIFGENKSISKIASGRIQGWAFFLSGSN